jgi:hypothetical protein
MKPSWLGLAVSGDLTASGDRSEFVQALSFLKHSVPITWKLRRGLEGCFDQVMCVPGDEDHAGGATPTRWPSPARQVYFEDAPPSSSPSWFFHKRALFPGLCLQICGLDSCGLATAKYRKGGAFDPASLLALEAEIAQANATTPRMVSRTLRLLVLHHSPAHQKSTALTRAGQTAEELDAQARNELDNFCRTNEIHFVLTGHAHEPAVPATYAGFGTELRCGATVERYDPAQVGFGHVFLAHSIKVTGRTVEWETRKFQRSPRGGLFRPDASSFKHQF